MTLAVPSYVAPGTWLENLRLAEGVGWIRGVELLFFAYDEDARRAMAIEAPAIAALADRFEFSLHLPDPLGDADEELVELASPFVRLFVAHPPVAGDAAETARWAKLLGAWRGRYGDRFALEYTGRAPFAAAERALPGLPLCPDAGRLALDGEEIARWIAARADRVVELHAHAARDGKDHLPLSGEEPWLPRALVLAEAGDWRLVLEVFSLSEAAASARAIERARGSLS